MSRPADGSRYCATVASVSEDGRSARVRYTHLMEAEDGDVPLIEDKQIDHLRPCPPRVIGFASKLRRGSVCEVWHEDGWWDARFFGRTKGKGGFVGYEVFSEAYAQIDCVVPASKLRPKMALVNRTDWLALPPIGFKCPVGATEYVVGEEEVEVTEEEAAEAEAKRKAAKAAMREEAAAAKAAAKEEAAAAKAAVRAAAKEEAEAAKAAAKEEAAAARAAVKEEAAAAKAAAKEEAAAAKAAAKEAAAAAKAAAKEEAAAAKAAAKEAAAAARAATKGAAKKAKTASKEAEAGLSTLPRDDSLRHHCLRALCSGLAEREDIVSTVARASDGRFARSDTVTVLGKEKSFRVPLWSQESSSYALTDDGRDAARRGGMKVKAAREESASPSATPGKKQKKRK